MKRKTKRLLFIAVFIAIIAAAALIFVYFGKGNAPTVGGGTVSYKWENIKLSSDPKITSIEYAPLTPSVAVRARKDGERISYSTDGGTTWTKIKNLPVLDNGGSVAVSADGSAFIWCSPAFDARPYITENFGETWYQCQGLGFGSKVVADKVNPNKFYAVCNGIFYTSTDGGFYFDETDKDVSVDAIPFTVSGRENSIWFISNGTVMYTENSGKTFTVLDNFSASVIGFGAPETNGAYPTVYAIGKEFLNGQVNVDGTGVYRSTDKGATWKAIGDKSQLNDSVLSGAATISGDSAVFGNVKITLKNGDGFEGKPN